MAKVMSKSELIQKIVDQHPNDMTRKNVKGVIESLAEIGYKELKKTGAFFVPGFAKFVVIKKPATKARKGINPFTKEPTLVIPSFFEIKESAEVRILYEKTLACPFSYFFEAF